MADKRIYELTTTATEADLVAGKFFVMDGQSGPTPRLPANLVAPRSGSTDEIKNLSTTATEADLVSGNYFAISGSAGTKKLPGDCIAKAMYGVDKIDSLAIAEDADMEEFSSIVIKTPEGPKRYPADRILTGGNFGEAVNEWLDNHPEATTTVEDHSLTYKKLINGTLSFVTPEMYGAKGDGVTDDTDAIKDALASELPVLLTSRYLISDTIVNPYCLFGSGYEKARIIMADNTKPVIRYTMNMSGCLLSGFRIIYQERGPKDNTNACGILINSSQNVFGQAVFTNIMIENTYSGIYANCSVYSCDFSNIWINAFKYAGIYMSGTGSTGIVMSNIYITNWGNYSQREMLSANFGIYLGNYTEGLLQQVNVEHGRFYAPLYFNQCELLKLESTHFEGVVNTNNYQGFIANQRSNLVIDTLFIGFSGSSSEGYRVGDTNATSVFLFSVNDFGTMTCEYLRIRDTQFSYASNKELVIRNASDSTARCDFELKKFEDVSSVITISASNFVNDSKFRKPEIKNLGGGERYVMERGCVVRYMDSAVSDPLLLGITELSHVGDRFVPTVPTTISEWVVTKKGYINTDDIVVDAKVPAWTNTIFLSALVGIEYGDRVDVDGNVFDLVSNIYSSSTYPEYPFAVNTQQNVNTAITASSIKMAAPTIKSVALS